MAIEQDHNCVIIVVAGLTPETERISFHLMCDPGQGQNSPFEGVEI
jgi:hypothetical protein